MKSKIILMAKALVTLGLLAYLALSLDFALVGQNIASLQLQLFVAVVAVHFLSVVPIEAYRLYVAFPYENRKFREFAKLSLFNAFVRNFLPSNLGPSLYTIIYLQRQIPSRVELVARMLLLRSLGLLTLLSLVLIYLVYDFTSISKVFQVRIEYGIFSYVLLASVLVISIVYALRKTRLMSSIFSHFQHAQKVLRGVSFKDILVIVLWSVAFHLIRGLAFWGLATSLGIEITWGLAIFLLSANAILLMLPISIGGIGLQESFLIFGLGAFGIPIEPAGALVFLYRILLLIMAFIGGIAYFVNLRLEKAQH